MFGIRVNKINGIVSVVSSDAVWTLLAKFQRTQEECRSCYVVISVCQYYS